jgi:arylamine N-acetyltransferase
MLDPLPFGPGAVHEQSGWQFRIVEDGNEFVLQSKGAGDWEALYGFVPEPVPLIDVETSNWYISTNPRSPFVSGLMVSLLSDDGQYALLGDRDGLSLAEGSPAGETVTPLSIDELPELLADRFGLMGHSVGTDGRLSTDRVARRQQV